MTYEIQFPEWFCLSDGRKNFLIDPVEDDSVLFGDPAEEERIRSRLKRSQLLAIPMRLVWWGQYGIGKTHRLRRTARIIAEDGFKFDPHYVVCGDISEKTGFDRLHFQLVTVLGMDAVCKNVTDYVFKLRSGEDLPSLKDLCGTSSDVEKALFQFGSGNEMAVRPAWQFLCGLKPDNPATIGVIRPKLELTSDYSAVLNALATIIEAETGKQLLYLIDEAEKLTRITNRTAEASWNETLRAMLDIKNLNVVLTLGAEKLDQLPKLILMPDLVRRIQKDNYLVMEAYKTQTASIFVKELLGRWIDGEKRDAVGSQEGFVSNYPSYDPALYPFAGEDAFEVFVENVTVDARDSKPSVILDKLNNVAADAYFQGKKLITAEFLAEHGYS